MKTNSMLMGALAACLVLISCVPPGSVYKGSYRIYNPFGLMFVSNYTAITGNLAIDQGDGAMVEPAALIKIKKLMLYRI